MASYSPVHHLCSDYQGCYRRSWESLWLTGLKTECGAKEWPFWILCWAPTWWRSSMAGAKYPVVLPDWCSHLRGCYRLPWNCYLGSQWPNDCFVPEVTFKLQLDLSTQLQQPLDALLFTVNEGKAHLALSWLWTVWAELSNDLRVILRARFPRAIYRSSAFFRCFPQMDKRKASIPFLISWKLEHCLSNQSRLIYTRDKN